MISYVLPTRDRPDELRETIQALGRVPRSIHDSLGGAEAIIVDNASAAPARLPRETHSGLQIEVVRLGTNQAAAGRNAGVHRARGDWIIMLDDDSAPIDGGFAESLLDAGSRVAAIGADIRLPGGAREAGGLPEVFVGCGVAIRREAFLETGGYDPALGFYAEEYDLCARLIHAGWRIIHDRRFRVEHRKVARGRDMDAILRFLVRNNAWIAQRYSPEAVRRTFVREAFGRYARIAAKERALAGYARGALEAAVGLRRQRRQPLPESLHDRFTGLAAARERLAGEPLLARGARVAIVDAGKNSWAVRRALMDLGVTLRDREPDADALVIGSLSPGPMLDSWERRIARGQPIIRPWAPIERAEEPRDSRRGSAAAA